MFVSGADIKPALRQRTGGSGQQRLIGGISPPQPVATELVLVQIEFATHAPVCPERIDHKGMTEHFDTADSRSGQGAGMTGSYEGEGFAALAG